MLTRLLVAAAVLTPTLAFPCSGLTCEATFSTIPAAGSTIPANAPAVGIRATLFSEALGDGGSWFRTSSVTSSSLRLATGVTLLTTAVTIEDALLFFTDGGLAQGSSYVVSFGTNVICTGDAGFNIGPAAPLPTVSATLALEGFEVNQGQPGNYCGGNVGPVQGAKLRIVASNEMTPWLALARWELEVDGENWSTSTYGRIGTVPQIGLVSGYRSGIDSFHVKCGTWDGGSSNLGVGTHQARVLARIAGVAAPIASNTISVTFDCAGADAGVAIPNDGGSNIPKEDGGGVTPQPNTPDGGYDAGVQDGGVGGPSGRGGGCSALPGSQSLLMMSMALLALSRRRAKKN